MKTCECRPWIPSALVAMLVAAVCPKGSSAQSAVMDPVGVTRITMNPGYSAIGINMVKPVLWRGLVTSATTASLVVNGAPALPSRPCYVEIISGVLEGDRIDVAGVAGATIALNVAAPHNTLASATAVPVGAQLVIREHFVLSDLGLLLGGAVHQGEDSSQSDVVLFYEGGFRSYFPFLDGSWYEDFGDTNLADRKILAPGSGVLYYRHPAAGAARLIVTGDVRANLMRVPLQHGRQMISTGFPENLSPAQLAMIPPEFVAGDDSTNSDTILTWEDGFKSHFLFSGDATWYQDYGNNEPVSGRPLFSYGASVVFQSIGAKSLDILKPY